MNNSSDSIHNSIEHSHFEIKILNKPFKFLTIEKVVVDIHLINIIQEPETNGK